MATLRDTLRTTLEADATLTALLTGGIYDASELGANGLPPATAFDSNGRMKPIAVIRWRNAMQGSINEFTERRYVEVWFYANAGYATIESAKARVKVDIHRQKFTGVTGTGLCHFEWIDDLGEFPADEFENAASDRSRYIVSYTVADRKT